MVATAMWGAVTTVGWPPTLPLDISWSVVLFGGFSFLSLFSLLWENLGLTAPHLELVYKPENGEPYVFDKQGVDGKTLRLHRVGVLNKGASAGDVTVKLMRCVPAEQGKVYPGHELQVMGHPSDTLSVTIHRSVDGPLVFFDVIGQLFKHGEPSDCLHIRYAAQSLYARSLERERYELTLAIHGQGASSPMHFVVERDRHGRQWILRRELGG